MASSSSSSPSSSSSLSFFDDTDWEFAGADEMDDMGGDVGWVITGNNDGYFVPGPLLAFVSLHPSSSLSTSLGKRLIPASFSISASSGGLLLSRGPWSSYCVSNPAAGTSAILPKPPAAHHPHSPLAIVYTGNAYHVVCANASAVKGAYSFIVFSSSTGAWKSSEQVFVLGRISSKTCVSCGGVAYWRTEAETVVAYDVMAVRARTLTPPENVSEAGGRWQLGRAGDKLCCALVTGLNLEVYALEAMDRWSMLWSVGIVVGDHEEEWDGGGEVIVCREPPRVLRFECDEAEVVAVAVDGRLVVVELEGRKMRAVEFEREASPELYDECLPYVDDPLASLDFCGD